MSLVRSEESGKELLEAQAHVWNHIFNSVNSMSLKCAVELGIPDIIQNHGQSITLSNLIGALQIHPNKKSCFRRLITLLTHNGFFALKNKTTTLAAMAAEEEEEEEEYLLTPASKLLLKDSPFGLAPLLFVNLEPGMVSSWLSLSTWFKDNYVTSFETAHGGVKIPDYPSHNDLQFQKMFIDAMVNDSKLIAKVLINDFKVTDVFKGIKTLVDVGGGTGTMAKAIVEAFPNINSCIVLDRPFVVQGCQETNKLHFVGDMFQSIPSADALFLKWIFHNYDDKDSIKLLKLCKEAIPSKEKGGKLIIIDMVLESQEVDKQFFGPQSYFDMLMKATNNGVERTEKEWKQLFSAAGYSSLKIHYILGARSLIEAYP